jgi:NAD(P)-dependent dehydrogenase (short-subunit alcohol dehydrogenase family)
MRNNRPARRAVLTSMWERVDAEYSELQGKAKGSMTAAFTTAIPLGRMGQPSDYIGPATFLASDDSAYMTGQTAKRRWGPIPQLMARLAPISTMGTVRRRI